MHLIPRPHERFRDRLRGRCHGRSPRGGLADEIGYVLVSGPMIPEIADLLSGVATERMMNQAVYEALLALDGYADDNIPAQFYLMENPFDLRPVVALNRYYSLADPGPLVASGHGEWPPFIAQLKHQALKELHALLCNQKKYERERKQLLNGLNAGRTATIAALSTFMAAHLGSIAPIIVPMSIVFMTAAGHVGLKAWCSTMTVWLEDNKPPDAP